MSALTLAGALPALRDNGEPSLLYQLLTEQAELTAVERFSTLHAELPSEGRYQELIPLSAPGPGQQYAFEVDLDLCTGCKACVTGCHTMNGLDDGEIWRTVGLLHGGTAAAPALQTVTTSCHHCVDPACMNGCPALAYEKDALTGIVRHLDDQCIGCQYCVFMCPYDAPKFNPARGIVRKCDMCSSRLAAQQAPACVQACPNQAIRIRVTEQAAVVDEAEANVFLPGAHAPGDTLPTTVYRTARAVPRNLLAADHYALSPQHAHTPLAIMLVLTQLSVGTFVLALVLGVRHEASSALVALLLGLAALAASTLHLGRPERAWRALLGLRRSWLSREVLAFALFAAAACGQALALWRGPAATHAPLAWTVAATGVGAVLCSVMVYAATRRELWSFARTGARFGLTTVVLGAATLLALTTLAGRAVDPRLRWVLGAAAAAKLLLDAALLRHLAARRHTVLRRSALLMVRELHRATLVRFLVGGAALLLLVPAPTPVLALLCGVLCLTGELAERHLFFAAAVSPKMPGGPA